MARTAEVIRLRTAANVASVPGQPESDAVVPYDFLRPTKLPRDQMRLLYVCLDTFTRRLTTLLTSTLRQVSQVELVSVEQMAYDEYISGLPSPTLLAPITLEPLAGTAILQFELKTALACIDHMLGGPGGEQPDRLPTEVETGLLRGLLEKMLGILQYALQAAVPLIPSLGVLEFNPQFAQAAGPSDPMLVVELGLVIGTDRTDASLCLPLGGLSQRLALSLAHSADTSGDANRLEAARRVRSTIATTPVPVCVGFEPIAVDPAVILSLQAGDLLPLRHRVTEPLVVGTGGQVLARALAGRSGDLLAALVVAPAAGPVTDAPENPR